MKVPLYQLMDIFTPINVRSCHSAQTGNLEIALTGAAFEKLSKIPLASFDNGDPFSDIQMASNRDDDDLIFNSQLKPLLRYTRIFARMKPDQKVRRIFTRT